MRKLFTLWMIFGVAGTELLAAPPEKDRSLVLSHTQKLELVWIQPGRFQMGSPGSDPLAEPDEKPQREIAIKRGF